MNNQLTASRLSTRLAQRAWLNALGSTRLAQRAWLNALGLVLVLECQTYLLAQEAASDVVGFIEINVGPGKSEPLAPLFLPAPSGSGTVKAVINAAQITPEWFGVLPEPKDTAAWFPLTGAFVGTPIFGSEIEDSSDWSLSPEFRGNPFTGEAVDSPLQLSDRFSVVPFWTVEELAGRADNGRVHASSNRSLADAFSFAGNTVWAGKPETDLARWVSWDSENPGDEDAGGSVISEVMGATTYLRSAAATSSLRLFVQGAARASTLSFYITPGQDGDVDAPLTPMFRPDGKEFTLTGHLGLYTNNAATGLVGGASPEVADKLVIWSADIQEWERFYYKTTAPIGWKSLRPRTINPAAVKVPSGSSFYVERPSTRPALKLPLPTVPNTALVNTTLFAQIIDMDKDRLADGWEKISGDKSLSMLPGGDADGDGFTHLEEYLLGGDPDVFDHPAMPLVEVRVLPSGVREAWLTFTASLGCRYRVEKRLASSTAWAAVGSILTGTGDEVEVKDPVALGTVDRAPRFYRVVGLAPADTDADLLSDFEEVSVYETDLTTADTDLDGVKDGAEVRTPGRNPLDYYDGRAVSFLVDAVSDRQVTAPGQWLRQAIVFTVKSGTKALVNAPVTFSLTNGAGKFAALPGDTAACMPVLTVRTDAAGKAKAFLYVASTSGVVQGRAVARVNDAGGGAVDQIYSAGFITYVSPHLIVPSEGLVRWFRPDTGVNRVAGSAEVASLVSMEGSGSAGAINNIGPTQITDLGRAWLAFTGAEKLDVGSGLLPNNTFNAFFTAAPSYTRTEPAPSVASTALNAGATGQAYLLAGETVNGQSVIVYDPPAKPADRSFSIWTITDFRAYNGDTIFRRYSFPTATGRHDGTDGYRNSPAPVGDHNPATQAGIEPIFATSFPNHRFDSSYTRTVNFNTSLGFKYAEERFYKVYATDWKGNSASAAYGGVKRIDYSRVGAAGLGLSVGANSTGAFELHQYWKPAISAKGIYNSATGFSTPKTFIGSLRVVNKIPYLDVGGYRRITGSTAYSKSTAVLAPRFIGGWETTGNGYKGKLGDLLLYNRDLTTADRYQVEDYLAASYRGVYELDRDKDGLPDWWERGFFGNYAQAAAGDPDGDTSNNAEEYAKGTHPGQGDTDGDGWSDKLELTKKSNPLTWDSDFDLIDDAQDALFLNASNGQADTDHNGIADGIDQLILNHDLQDSDNDGISDMLEAFWLSTGVLLDDTDGDLLPDGFEFYGGLDALDTTGHNGTHGNPDNDGLDNLDELIYSTNPSAADTDGDGVSDGAEINQGTDPNKPGDGDTPPPPDELIDVVFRVGDGSGSHSERWAMKITSRNAVLDSKTIYCQSRSFGEIDTKTLKLRRGCGYQVELKHLGTDPEFLKRGNGKPDYDWDAQIEGLPNTPVKEPGEEGKFFAISKPNGAWIIDNSSGLLGYNDQGELEPNDASVGRLAILLPVDLKEAWSDQITDVEANGMPDQTGNANKAYIFMGGKGDGKGHAKLKLGSAVAADMQNKILWRLAPANTPTSPSPGNSTYDADGTTVRVTIDAGSIANADDKDYVVVVGFDQNGDGNLASGELLPTPKCMHDPPGGGVNRQSLPFKFTIVSQARYTDSKQKNLTNAGQFTGLGLPNAGELLTSFCNGTQPPQSTGFYDIKVSRTETGLSHPVGILFTPKAEPGDSKRWVFNQTVAMGQDFVRAGKFRDAIKDNVLNDYTQEISDYFSQNPDEDEADFSWTWSALVGESDHDCNPTKGSWYLTNEMNFQDIDMWLALGRVTIDGSVKITVNWTQQRITDVKFTGTVDDLYDFDYDDKGFSIPLTSITVSPALAAEVQAGFNTLGAGGRVFKNRLIFDQMSTGQNFSLFDL